VRAGVGPRGRTLEPRELRGLDAQTAREQLGELVLAEPDHASIRELTRLEARPVPCERDHQLHGAATLRGTEREREVCDLDLEPLGALDVLRGGLELVEPLHGGHRELALTDLGLLERTELLARDLSVRERGQGEDVGHGERARVPGSGARLAQRATEAFRQLANDQAQETEEIHARTPGSKSVETSAQSERARSPDPRNTPVFRRVWART